MKAEINNKGKCFVTASHYDVCYDCTNIADCPLITAIRNEVVVTRYAEIKIGKCALHSTDKTNREVRKPNYLIKDLFNS